jgi:hypothetical protein
MIPAAVPLIVKYIVPLAAYGIGHLVGWFHHKKYAGPSLGDIAKP